MSGSAGSGVDVDMRVSSKRGFVDDESAPSWVSALMERRMDQRLDANERRIELRMDERLDTNERRIEQVLGLHQVRLDKHDVELSAQRRLLEDLRSEIGDFRKSGVEPSRPFNDQSSETPSTVGSTNFSGPGEWCPRKVLVRGWAPFGSPASQKIDRVEYKKVANELLSCLLHSLYNNVTVRAPFAANFQISFGLKKWRRVQFVSGSSRGFVGWCGIKYDYSSWSMGSRSRLRNHNGRRRLCQLCTGLLRSCGNLE